MKAQKYDFQTKETTTTTVPDVTITESEYWSELRETRDALLRATDTWALSDRSITDAQKKYRQDLRDLPANTSDPAKPTWPSKP